MKLNGQCFVVYHADNEIAFFYIKSWYTCAYSVYFKSKKELNYDRFVDPNVRGVLFFDIIRTPQTQQTRNVKSKPIYVYVYLPSS